MVRAISEEEKMLAAGYVLGDLEPFESAEFELKLINNPDLQAEINAFQIAYNKLPQGLPQLNPPPELKTRIIDSFVASSSFANPAAKQLQFSEFKNSSSELHKKFAWGRILAGIVFLISGLLVFDNFNLRQQLKLAQQVDQQELASILAQPKSRLLALSNSEEQVLGSVLFTPGNWQQVILSAKDLPPLSVDQVYRMWLELANGQVILCGEFKTTDRGSIFIKLNAKQNPPAGVKAKGVFVTIEQVNSLLEPKGQKIIRGNIS